MGGGVELGESREHLYRMPNDGTSSGKLIYFDMNGRADAIRTMLAHANFKYDDQRITSEEFALLRQRNGLPLGSMPVWEEDGYMVCQSSAILRMLGIRCGYYSEDPMICWAIDSLIDFHEGL